MIINILGTNYIYEEPDPISFNFNGSDGFCKTLDKEIYVKSSKFQAGDSAIAKKERYKHVIRHELVHAYMQESGRSYEDDEFLVDWIATMIPKIYETTEDIVNKMSDSKYNNLQDI